MLFLTSYILWNFPEIFNLIATAAINSSQMYSGILAVRFMMMQISPKSQELVF